MPFCPNPECPYKKRVGKPAEYLEECTKCSDCGSPLSGGIVEEFYSQERPSSDFYKRIFYTISIVIIWRVIALVPAPGINSEAFQDFLRINVFINAMSTTTISVFALGLMPYITAYVVIEILSLFLRPFKSWRAQGHTGRKKLKTVALVATIFLALFHGYNIALGLEGMPQGEIVRNPGIGFRLVLALTVTTGTFITIWLAELISRKGIGHGISIFIFTGLGGRLFYNFLGIKKLFEEHGTFGFYVLLLIATITLIALIIFFERSQRKIPVQYSDGVEAYLPLKLTTAGTVPADWASSFVILFATVAGFITTPWAQNISRQLFPGNLVYSIALFIAIFFFYYLFTAFFYNPRKIVTLLKNRNAELVFSKNNKEDRIDRSLEIMAFIGALYLCGIVLLPEIIFRLFGFYIGGIDLIVAVAIVLDLVEEGSKRKKGESLIKVAEVHDIPIAGLVKSVLEQRGITCYLRGYYHRALLYFFGPYIEVSVLIPEDKVMDAQEVIGNYIDPKIIIIYNRA